ncbi:MAG TPA: diguanylate cyclase [Phycisphaerae bacterium]|nr:diguanylate cyclase [Phycisphaerae bacterium]
MKILAVEDDFDQRELIRETLVDHFGQDTVTCAECGHEVLQWDLEKFDVILTDFNLPDINGMDFLKAILSKVDRPVIVVTGENVRQTAAQAIRAGAYDYIVKAGEYLFTIPLVVEKNLEAWKVKQENKRLHEQQQAAAREISIKNQQLKDSLHKLEQMAATDPLTGLYNRRHFGEVLERYFAESARYGQDLACIMCDLDGYKKLNDTLGHQFGDKILQVTSKIITWNLRVMDVAARYGGDEFVVLLPHASAELATSVGERIHSQFVFQMKALIPSELSLTMSMGISSVLHNHPVNSDQLVALADEALYTAKHRGKNQTIVSDKIRPAPPELKKV